MVVTQNLWHIQSMKKISECLLCTEKTPLHPFKWLNMGTWDSSSQSHPHVCTVIKLHWTVRVHKMGNSTRRGCHAMNWTGGCCVHCSTSFKTYYGCQQPKKEIFKDQISQRMWENGRLEQRRLWVLPCELKLWPKWHLYMTTMFKGNLTELEHTYSALSPEHHAVWFPPTGSL